MDEVVDVVTDMVRAAGLLKAAERLFRKVDENASVIASTATNAVNVFVVK